MGKTFQIFFSFTYVLFPLMYRDSNRFHSRFFRCISIDHILFLNKSFSILHLLDDPLQFCREYGQLATQFFLIARTFQQKLEDVFLIQFCLLFLR